MDCQHGKGMMLSLVVHRHLPYRGFACATQHVDDACAPVNNQTQQQRLLALQARNPVLVSEACSASEVACAVELERGVDLSDSAAAGCEMHLPINCRASLQFASI